MRFEFSGNPVRYGCIMAGSGLPVRPTWHPLRQFALLRGRGGRRGLHRIGLATNEREHRRQILGLDEHLTGLRPALAKPTRSLRCSIDVEPNCVVTTSSAACSNTSISSPMSSSGSTAFFSASCAICSMSSR